MFTFEKNIRMIKKCLTAAFSIFAYSHCIIAQQDSSKSIVLIGGYTEKMGWVEGTATGIGVYEFNPTTCKLTMLSTSTYIKNPSYIALSPNKKNVYAVSEIGGDANTPTGKLFSYYFDNKTYTLKELNNVSSQGTSPCYVEIDKTGKFALVANYGNGSVASMYINENGTLEEAKYVDQHIGKGPMPQQENAHAHNITTSLSNKYIYSNDLGSDKIFIYQFDNQNGSLIATQNNFNTKKGAGPRQMCFHPTMKTTYSINELNGTIDVFDIETITGKLTCKQTISTLSAEDKLPASCADIKINGDYLYASNRAKHNNIAIFKIDKNNGKLSLIGHHSTLGKTPRFFCFDKTGKFILIANQDSNTVVVFKIDQQTGMFIEPGIVNEVPTPTCILFY